MAASALTTHNLSIVNVFSASIEPSRFVTASPESGCCLLHLVARRTVARSAVMNTAVVYGTRFEVCVDRFHDVPNVTPGLLNVDDSGVLEAGSFDE